MADTPENKATQLPIPKLGREAKPRPFKWRAAASGSTGYAPVSKRKMVALCVRHSRELSLVY